MTQLPGGLVRFVLYVLVVGPPVAISVYRDRSRRDATRPLRWAVGIELLGIPVLVGYLLLEGRLEPESG